jgi:7,8-dihydro-6-hydroxymethylpterin-pyrophosphokinase
MISLAYVGLGSNLGDRSGFLLLGIKALLDSRLPVSRFHGFMRQNRSML